jgi:hypothetical protein
LLKRFRPHNPQTGRFVSRGPPQDHRIQYLQAAEADHPPGFISTSKGAMERALKQETYALRRRFEYASPIITIQKTVKGWLGRRLYKAKIGSMPILVNALTRWYTRKKLHDLVTGMGLTRAELYKIGRVRFLQRICRAVNHRERVSAMFKRRFISICRMKAAQNKSLPWALGLTQTNPF